MVDNFPSHRRRCALCHQYAVVPLPCKWLSVLGYLFPTQKRQCFHIKNTGESLSSRPLARVLRTSLLESVVGAGRFIIAPENGNVSYNRCTVYCSDLRILISYLIVFAPSFADYCFDKLS